MKFSKVTLRKKKLAKGRISLYLDFYPPVLHTETGKETRREFLNLHYIDRPRTPADTTEKENCLALAASIRLKREVQIRDGQAGISAVKGKESFLVFFSIQAEKQTGSTAKGYKQTLKHLADFVGTGNDVPFQSVTPEFADNFQHYLQTKARNKTAGRTGGLSNNTTISYFVKFMAIVGKAVSGGHIQTNFPKSPRAKPKETIRDFLTLEELQALAATPCELDYLKNASLFSALTGLRFSDVEKLRWEEVKETAEGYNIEFRIQKTGDMERLPISDKAYSLLGARRMPASRVFPELKYSYWLNTKLREWVAAAGIGKKIAFHCFRHTYAMLQLEGGTDLFTLSKLMGHKDIETTQIYAKVQDKKKRESVNRIDIDLSTKE